MVVLLNLCIIMGLFKSLLEGRLMKFKVKNNSSILLGIAIAVLVISCTLLIYKEAKADTSLILSVAIEQDATDASILSTKATTSLGNSIDHAVSVEGAFGKKTARVNTTYGVALAYSSFLKLTHDFLYQNRRFDYGSDIGSANERVYQNAFGVAYRHYFNLDFPNSFQVSTYFNYAPSKEASIKSETLSYSYAGDGTYSIRKHRARLAGSKATNTDIETTVVPWANATILTGVNYSTLSFDKIWEEKTSYTGFGLHAKYSQVVNSWLKLNSHYRLSRVNGSVGFGASMLLPPVQDIQFELVGDFSRQKSMAIDKPYWVSNLVLKTYLWQNSPRKYTALSSPRQTLKDWVSKPVVRIQDVLVAPETHYTTVANVNTYLSAPTGAFLRTIDIYKDINDHGILWANYNGARWRTLERDVLADSTFNSLKASFYRAEYDEGNGTIKAYYSDDGAPYATEHNNTLVLIYSGDKEVVGVIGDTWKDGVCRARYASSCRFEVEM
jgi:hypothetical protein